MLEKRENMCTPLPNMCTPWPPATPLPPAQSEEWEYINPIISYCDVYHIDLCVIHHYVMHQLSAELFVVLTYFD